MAARGSIARGVAAGCLLGGLGLAACTTYRPFDSTSYLRDLYAQQVGAERAREIEVPFALDDATRQAIQKRLKPSGSEVQRANDIVDYIFHGLDLEYQLMPTHNAVDTYRNRKGNCLSFVNLFLGIARLQRLNAFYVEVTDAQQWSHSRGMVISQGHIVAGTTMTGSLKVYDFLPGRAKAYRDFKPIDDLTGAAHYFNNLGAEALIAGDEDHALHWIQLATEVAPRFAKGLNNLGVTLARLDRHDEALDAYRRGLAVEADDEALLTNLLRLYQELGRVDEAAAILARLDQLKVENPYFYVYKGELALGRGDLKQAMDLMVEALRHDSEVPEVHVGLAKVYVALGDLEEARSQLARALKLDVTNAEARRLAAMLGPTTRGDGT